MSTMGKLASRSDLKANKKLLSFAQRLAIWYDDFMFDYFPPGQDFPAVLRFPFGLIFLGGTIVIFITLFVTGFWQAQSKVFLAPEKSAEGICKPVPVANSGTFLGTIDGYWQGSVNFSFSNAAYVITMNDFSITEDQYADVISRVESAMRHAGLVAQGSDLAFNVLLWSTFVIIDAAQGVTQRFYMTGEPMQILDREFTDVTLSNYQHDCGASNSVKFDTNNARLRVDWDYDVFSQPSSNCTEMMDPLLFGYNYASARSSKLSMQIDMRTVLVAVAVNYGILSPSSLTLLPNLRQTFTFDALTYVVDRFVDPRYPGMTPLSCIVSQSPQMCVIVLGNVPTLPGFFHTGQSLASPQPCVCGELPSIDLEDINHPCHAFNFMVGFLFYNTADPAPLFELFSRSLGNSSLRQSYFATWLASSFGQKMSFPADQRAEIFSFCSTSRGNCSMLTANFYDLYGQGFTLSRNYYQLLRGACRDSFSGVPETWDRFRSATFAPLAERYVECQNTFWDVFTDQTGIAFGNSQLITPAFTMLLVLCVMVLKRRCGYGEVEVFTKNAKADAVGALADTMLATKENLLRKRHVSGDAEAGRGQESYIAMLVQELEWHVEGLEAEEEEKSCGEEEGGDSWGVVKDKLRSVLSLLRSPRNGAKVQASDLPRHARSSVYSEEDVEKAAVVDEGEEVNVVDIAGNDANNIR